MAYLELNNITKNFGAGANLTEVLDDINLHIEEGEFVAIVGFTATTSFSLSLKSMERAPL
jgi:nitrate/nitrite transport system ATP-binding protein